MIRGGCLCGDVRWELDGPIELINFCHCSMCRRVHGTAFGAFGHASAERFRWARGVDAITRYESSPDVYRCFCRRCGSAVPVVEGDELCIPAGGIDGDPGARPAMHIFVGSKAGWYDIADALPQFDAFPPDNLW